MSNYCRRFLFICLVFWPLAHCIVSGDNKVFVCLFVCCEFDSRLNTGSLRMHFLYFTCSRYTIYGFWLPLFGIFNIFSCKYKVIQAYEATFINKSSASLWEITVPFSMSILSFSCTRQNLANNLYSHFHIYWRCSVN